MSPVAFLDANVPIYAAGRPHPLKGPCAQVLFLAGEHPERFVTDAEVLRELIHRYLALRQWPSGKDMFRRFAELMQDRVEDVRAADVERVAELADRDPNVSGRDLLHAAIMERLDVHRVVSADRDFDRFVDLERLDPAHVNDWRDALLD